MKREIASVTQSVICEVCVAEKIGNGCIKFQDCGHTHCRDCMTGYFAVRVFTAQVNNLTCTLSGCSSQALPDQVGELVPKDLFNQYERGIDSTKDTIHSRVEDPPKALKALKGEMAHSSFVPALNSLQWVSARPIEEDKTPSSGSHVPKLVATIINTKCPEKEIFLHDIIVSSKPYSCLGKEKNPMEGIMVFPEGNRLTIIVSGAGMKGTDMELGGRAIFRTKDGNAAVSVISMSTVPACAVSTPYQAVPAVLAGPRQSFPVLGTLPGLLIAPRHIPAFETAFDEHTRQHRVRQIEGRPAKRLFQSPSHTRVEVKSSDLASEGILESHSDASDPPNETTGSDEDQDEQLQVRGHLKICKPSLQPSVNPFLSTSNLRNRFVCKFKTSPEARQNLCRFFTQTLDALRLVPRGNAGKSLNIPTLMTPDRFGTVEKEVDSNLSDDQRSILGSIAKFLQFAASEKGFRDEDHDLMCLHSSIIECHETFKQLFEDRYDVDKSMDQPNIDQYTEDVLIDHTSSVAPTRQGPSHPLLGALVQTRLCSLPAVVDPSMTKAPSALLPHHYYEHTKHHADLKPSDVCLPIYESKLIAHYRLANESENNGVIRTVQVFYLPENALNGKKRRPSHIPNKLELKKVVGCRLKTLDALRVAPSGSAATSMNKQCQVDAAMPCVRGIASFVFTIASVSTTIQPSDEERHSLSLLLQNKLDYRTRRKSAAAGMRPSHACKPSLQPSFHSSPTVENELCRQTSARIFGMENNAPCFNGKGCAAIQLDKFYFIYTRLEVPKQRPYFCLDLTF